MTNIGKRIGRDFTKSIKTSFRGRLFTGITAVILIVCTGFASLLFYQQYQAQQEKKTSEGNLMAKLLARDVRLAVFSGSRDEILLAAQGTMSLPEVQAVEVYNRDGLLLARLSRPTADLARYTAFKALIPGLLNRELEKSIIIGQNWGSNPESSVGSVKVVVDESMAEQRLRRLIIVACLATAVFLGFGVIAAFFLARSMAGPIIELSACAAALKDGDDTVQAPIETVDEIGQLASTFNSMVEAIRLRTRDLEEALEELYQLNIALEDKVKKRTLQLEEANRELEAFNYSASHDLRAPLNRLAGFCDAFREEFGAKLDDEALHYLERIAATGRQMDLVLSAMLTLYQVQQRDMSPRLLDISELVRAVAASLRQRESDRNVEFVIQENVFVYGDMKLLWLALENLLGNAWKFTKERDVARIEFGETAHNGETACFIKDNGAGFDMAYYGNLFTPFQRLHNYDEFPGTGVGLAIVQRILARHGGRVWLESSEGVGTTCYFSLPKTGAAKNPQVEGKA